jgi:hypothetical protein
MLSQRSTQTRLEIASIVALGHARAFSILEMDMSTNEMQPMLKHEFHASDARSPSDQVRVAGAQHQNVRPSAPRSDRRWTNITCANSSGNPFISLDCENMFGEEESACVQLDMLQCEVRSAVYAPVLYVCVA